MFIVGYKMRYASGAHLNEISGEWPGTGALLSAAAEEAARVVRGWVKGSGAPSSMPEKRARSARLMSASKKVREEPELEFVVEPLTVPSVVRPDHERGVLYVRLAAPSSSSRVSVLPAAAEAVAADLERARWEGAPVQRAVLVGADSIVDPAATSAPGHEAALGALVDVIRAFAAAKVPFVWRTRGGIADQLPHALAHALVDAAPFIVVELGVPSLDPELAFALEGHAGVAPEHRVRLAAALVARHIPVRGLVDPLVPMLTDQQQSLEELVAALADAGVSRVGARYIVLTRERAKAVASRLAGMQRALLQGVFADEPWHKPDPDGGPREVHKRIPSHLRRAGHHRLLEAGARHGIHVDILDPVEDGEDLTDPGMRARPGSTPPSSSSKEGAPEPKRSPKLRRRPQLDLFRKSR
jgi:DNA repair photolyase